MSKIDKIDIQIVELLMQAGRMPAAEIARRIGGITERVVRYRIDRMVEEGLISISAIVHPQKIDYSVAADVFLEVETGLIQKVARKLAGYDFISYVACSIGETDVSVQVLAKDTKEIYRIVTEVIGKIPGVRKTTTSIVPVVLKDVYQWRIPVDTAVSSYGNATITKEITERTLLLP
jgi:Lrp/AsnC family transcriptional regulator for asnA, asnC and gidA